MIFPDIRLLILAFWLGAALSVLYGLMRALCLLFMLRKFTVFVSDLLFCLLCGAATFLLALAGTNGQPRLYWLVFEALGFFAVHVTCTPGLCRLASGILRAAGRIRGRIAQNRGKKRQNRASQRPFFRKRREKCEKKT